VLTRDPGFLIFVVDMKKPGREAAPRPRCAEETGLRDRWRQRKRLLAPRCAAAQGIAA
jgi:hypothetical protein